MQLHETELGVEISESSQHWQPSTATAANLPVYQSTRVPESYVADCVDHAKLAGSWNRAVHVWEQFVSKCVLADDEEQLTQARAQQSTEMRYICTIVVGAHYSGLIKRVAVRSSSKNLVLIINADYHAGTVMHPACCGCKRGGRAGSNSGLPSSRSIISHA